jgi:hypothetical protein
VELMVFFCERGAGFCREFGVDDEAFMAALVRMFEQALIDPALFVLNWGRKELARRA